MHLPDEQQTDGGGHVLINLPELNLHGFARLVGFGACPHVTSGPGRLVTGTFHHSSGDVCDVRFSNGSSLGATARHPVWSVDREDWVAVSDLNADELVEVVDGTTRFISATPRPESEPVYNLEVDADHCYRIDKQGLLVHNASLYRGMTIESGKPKIGDSAKMLGVRIPADIQPDADDNVHRPTPSDYHGMSAAPTIEALIDFRKPVAFGGTDTAASFRLWVIDDSVLGSDLVAFADSTTHVTIGPARTMKTAQFRAALAATQGKWKEVAPCP